MKVKIINGPNLNLLGERQKNIYGNISFSEYLKKLQKIFVNIQIDYFQSNIEGELINEIQNSEENYDYIILNAGGYSHTSVSITDAISSINTPVIEVHISNIYRREEYRRKSLLSENCKAVICGLGLDSYKAALSVI